MTDVSTIPPVFEQLTLDTPNMVFAIFKEKSTTIRVTDRGANTISSGEVVSIWETMDAAANELNSIINEIGEEEYSEMDEDFVIIIFEVNK